MPYGFIYDPAIGDPDGGILPGTEFTDIPDNWRCPKCGVTKADFVPYNNGDVLKNQKLKILRKKLLNETTLELTLEKPQNTNSKIGQFAAFEFSDEKGSFRRQYSVAREDKDSITFLIKITEFGRAGKIWRTLKDTDTLNFVGFFGDFILTPNKKPKIFVATGTGLAPIFRMMNESHNIDKKLFFSVATINEMFYLEELSKIPNLQVFSYISREKHDGHQTGRIQIDDIIAHMGEMDSRDVYLCGNPNMIDSFVPILRNYSKHILFEEFTT